MGDVTETTNGDGLTMAVIGTGNMAGAVLSGVLESCGEIEKSGKYTAPFAHFIACVQSKSSAERLKQTFAQHAKRLSVVYSDNISAMKAADVIFLGCKPYMAKQILEAEGVREALEGKLLISILAGSPIASLQEFIYAAEPPSSSPKGVTIIRAQPNMAAQIRESMTVIATSEPAAPKRYQELTEWVFQQVGRTRPISDELFDAGSALVGATGAFMTVAFDGILDAAVVEGFKRSEAQEMLAQSLLGLAKLLSSGEHPAILREKVASPKGTTIRGLLALEKGGVRAAYSQALMDAAERGKSIR